VAATEEGVEFVGAATFLGVIVIAEDVYAARESQLPDGIAKLWFLERVGSRARNSGKRRADSGLQSSGRYDRRLITAPLAGRPMGHFGDGPTLLRE
jgi:hypothetical protein